MAIPSPPAAAPSRGARLLAFVAIVVAGACGGLIGFAVTDLQCGPDRGAVEEEAPDGDDGCALAAGVGGIAGAVVAAGGVAVLAVLVLRAMGEWHGQGRAGEELGRGRARGRGGHRAGPPR